ncbi:hypothetical protein B0H11DRAFT_1934979 [Mycena galericulata]|nr:hypothetical protein B0H11DRAFT_1934979 [Mycena galericulata]
MRQVSALAVHTAPSASANTRLWDMCGREWPRSGWYFGEVLGCTPESQEDAPDASRTRARRSSLARRGKKRRSPPELHALLKGCVSFTRLEGNLRAVEEQLEKP